MADGDPLLISRNNVGTHKTSLTKRPGQERYEFPALHVNHQGSEAAVLAVADGSSAARAVGVSGVANRGRGVVGSGKTGVQGNGSSAGVEAVSRAGTALVARTDSGVAGAFAGPVVVSGALAVSGTQAAAVPHPDGTPRLLYALQSPDAWFEDFGRGRLRKGRAQIKLDHEFARVIAGDYHVFVTPCGDCAGLYVHQVGKVAFEVRELGGGQSGVPFSYRIVAKRGDLRAARFAKSKSPLP